MKNIIKNTLAPYDSYRDWLFNTLLLNLLLLAVLALAVGCWDYLALAYDLWSRNQTIIDWQPGL